MLEQDKTLAMSRWVKSAMTSLETDGQATLVAPLLRLILLALALT